MNLKLCYITGWSLLVATGLSAQNRGDLAVKVARDSGQVIELTLQEAVERAVILAPGKLLEPDNFMLRPPYSSTTGDLETLNLMELEQKAIEKAMKKCEGNISRAAEMLGITRFALYRKLEKYEI